MSNINGGWIKLFLKIFLPLFLLMSVTVFFAYSHESKNTKVLLLKREEHQRDMQTSIITHKLEDISYDLVFLTDLLASHSVWERLNEFSHELATFAKHHGIYEQIRYLDKSGLEKIRINYNGGAINIVPPQKLQDKSKRYYFQETIRLKRNEVFLSPFDLNVENGQIEIPFKPILRLATPVFNQSGEKSGVFILNYMGANLFIRMAEKQTAYNSEIMLLNNEGYWLYESGESREWGFMFADKSQQTFSNAYPDIWEKIHNTDSGQLSSSHGYFTWGTVIPQQLIQQPTMMQQQVTADKTETQRAWKVITLLPKKTLRATLSEVQSSYLGIYLVLVFVLLLLSTLLTFFRAQQLQARKNRRLFQETQVFTNKLLANALSSSSLKQELTETLQSILSLSWLSVLSKGSIFLMDEKSNELVMFVEQGLAKPLLTQCARLPLGKCLCGRAAERKETIFTSCLNHEHEITYDGITEHGHICVPILKGDKVLGVLNLYVEHGHTYDPLYKDLLDIITRTLALIIERKQMDEHLQEAYDEASKHRDELAYERAIVEETLLKIRSSEEFNTDNIRYLESPVETTAGDILFSAKRPDGTQHILLGDFTGHGLPSALAVPLVADSFYGMTRGNVSAPDIFFKINKKLVDKLPTHLFLAACLIEFNSDNNRLSLWNAGLPEPILFRDGVPIAHHPGKLLPLGVTQEFTPIGNEQIISVKPGDRLYCFTDGIVEATNPANIMLGHEGLEIMLASCIKEELPLEKVLDDLTEYQASDKQADDITLLEITI